MRLYPLALIPLVLSLAAIILSVGTTGPLFWLTIGVAGATFLVSAAILFTYSRKSPEAKQIPLENFSLWADVGEPAAELRRLSMGDSVAAAHIASTDLASLAANAELLQSRAYMLIGRPGFESLLEEKIHRRIENVANDINSITKKINSLRSLPNEIIPQIEQCAAQADRVANKFFELESGTPEVVYLYLEPLRRASEKLSKDLRQASININKYLQWTPKPEAAPASAPAEAPAVSKVEAIQAARAAESAAVRAEAPAPPVAPEPKVEATPEEKPAPPPEPKAETPPEKKEAPPEPKPEPPAPAPAPAEAPVPQKPATPEPPKPEPQPAPEQNKA